MTDLVSRLLEAITRAEQAEHRKFATGWKPGDPCPLCDRPVDALIDRSVADWTAVVADPCGHSFEGDEAWKVFNPQPAPDQSILRRCAADRRQVERHKNDGGSCAVCLASVEQDEDVEGNWYPYNEMERWPCPSLRDVMDSYGLADHQEGS